MFIKKFSNFLKVLFLITICLVIFPSVLTSCENFLNGSELKEKLEKEIEYANASFTTIQVDIEANSGALSSSLEYKCKPGDTIELNFKENNGFQFVYWEITDSQNTVLSDLIEIKNLKEKSTTFKLLKEYPSIVKVHPVCFYKAILPQSSAAGVPENTSFIITFNRPIDTTTFSYAITNGSIFSEENYNDQYLAPEFSEDKQRITIRKNPKKSFGLQNGEKKTVTLKVSKDLKFLNQAFFLSEDFTNTIIINSENDVIPPVVTSLNVKKIGADNSICGESFFQGTFGEVIAHFGEDNFFYGHNRDEPHHLNKVHFDFSAYDSESGIAKIIVQEKTLYNVNGDDISASSSILQSEYLVDEFTYDSSVQTKDFIYDFTKTPGIDGIVELKFIPVDYSGNYEKDESRIPVFAMIRDTHVSIKIFASPNYFQDNPVEYSRGDNTYLNQQNFFKYFSLSADKSSDKWATYNEIEYGSDIDIASSPCYCGPDTDSYTKTTLVTSAKDCYSEYHFLWDRINYSRTKDYYFKLVLSDLAGNVKDYEVYEPAVNILYFEIEEDSDDSSKNNLLIYLPVYSEVGYNYDSLVYTTDENEVYGWENDSGYLLEYLTLADYSKKEQGIFRIKNIENKNYYIYLSGFFMGYVNGGETEYESEYYYPYLKTVVNPYDLFDNDDLIPPQISPENTFTSMGPNTGKYLLTVNLTEEELKKYDNVILEVISSFNTRYYSQYHTLNNVLNEIQIDSDEQYSVKYRLIGNKNGKSIVSDFVELGTVNINSLFYEPSISYNSFGNSFVFNPPKNVANMELDSDGNYIVRCYYSLYTINVEDAGLDSVSYIDLKVHKNAEKIEFPIESLSNLQGKLIVAPFIEDKFKNNNLSEVTYILKTGYYRRLFVDYSEKVMLDEITESDVKLKIKSVEKKSYFAIQYFDGEWKYPATLSGWTSSSAIKIYNGYAYDDSQPNISYSVFSIGKLIDEGLFVWGQTSAAKKQNKTAGEKFRSNIDQKFIKASYFYRDLNDASDYTISAPIYIYVDTDNTCSVKKLGDSTSIVTVHNDKPALVQLVYGTENFGMDPDKWERWCAEGHKTNIKVFESSVGENGVSTPNLYYVDNSDVPYGSYYTVIAHYADGTSKMTTPVRK